MSVCNRDRESRNFEYRQIGTVVADACHGLRAKAQNVQQLA